MSYNLKVWLFFNLQLCASKFSICAIKTDSIQHLPEVIITEKRRQRVTSSTPMQTLKRITTKPKCTTNFRCIKAPYRSNSKRLRRNWRTKTISVRARGFSYRSMLQWSSNIRCTNSQIDILIFSSIISIMSHFIV